jgi:hypothetical protein
MRGLQLRHIATRSFPIGLVQSEYHLAERRNHIQGRFGRNPTHSKNANEWGTRNPTLGHAHELR